MAYVIDHPTLNNGLKLYYAGDPRVEDLSGNGNHGYRYSGIYATEGNLLGIPTPVSLNPMTGHRAYLFHDRNGYFTPRVVSAGFTPMATTPTYWAFTSLTMACWIYMRRTAGNTYDCPLMEHYSLYLGFNGATGGCPLRAMVNGGYLSIFGSPYIYEGTISNEWHHLAASFAKPTLKLYVDGAPYASGYYNSDLLLPTGTQEFKVMEAKSSTDGYVLMSDACVWDRALLDAELLDLKNSQGYKDMRPEPECRKRYWIFGGSSFLNLTSAHGSGNFNPAHNFSLLAGAQVSSVAPGSKSTLISKISGGEGGYELYTDGSSLKFRVYSSSSVYSEVEISGLSAGAYFTAFSTFNRAFSISGGLGRMTVGFILNGIRHLAEKRDAVNNVVSTTADLKLGSGTLGGSLQGRLYWATYVPRAIAPVEAESCDSAFSDYGFDATSILLRGVSTGIVNGLDLLPADLSEPDFNVPRLNPGLLVDFHRDPGSVYLTDIPTASPFTLDVVGSPVRGGVATAGIAPHTQSWQFTRSGGYLSTPSQAFLNPAGDFSLVWCGYPEYQPSSGNYLMTLISKEATSQRAYELCMYTDVAGGNWGGVIFEVSANGTSTTYITKYNRLWIGKWVVITASYHYVGASNSQGVIYVNDSFPASSSSFVGPVFASTAPFCLGYDPFLSKFEGRVSYAAFLNRQLTQSEHRSLYNRTAWIESLSPDFLFRADQPIAPTVVSEAGECTLTLTGDTGQTRLNDAPRNLGIASLYRLRKKPF